MGRIGRERGKEMKGEREEGRWLDRISEGGREQKRGERKEEGGNFYVSQIKV